MERVTSRIFIAVFGWSSEFAADFRAFAGNKRTVVRDTFQLHNFDGHCCCAKASASRSRQQLWSLVAAGHEKIYLHRMLNDAAVT